MDWQIAGVAAVVAGAVYFLGQRVFAGRRRRKEAAQTFVPLSSVKKRTDHQCH